MVVYCVHRHARLFFACAVVPSFLVWIGSAVVFVLRAGNLYLFFVRDARGDCVQEDHAVLANVALAFGHVLTVLSGFAGVLVRNDFRVWCVHDRLKPS